MVSLIQAILIALVAALTWLDGAWLGEMKFREPIVTGFLVGLILGDVKSGVMIGAQLQLIWMGAVNIGPTAQLDIGTGGTIGAAVAIATGTGAETAILFGLPISVLMNKLMSYQEELALSGKVPKTEVLAACRQSTPKELSGPSDLGDPECFYLERLRSADGKASVHIQTYLPYSRFPGIERFDFAALSLYHTLAKEYGIHLRDAKRSLSAENASDREAGLLGVETGKALLLLESHTFDRNGGLVEVSFEHFAGDT